MEANVKRETCSMYGVDVQCKAQCTGRTERKSSGGLDVVWLIILEGIWNRT